MSYISKLLIASILGLLGAAATATEIKFDQNLADTHCKEKWTKRCVLDGNMFSYCMEKQTDGYGEALELYNRYSNIEKVELIDEVVSFALDKWAKRREYQMNMVAYEIEKQGEAYLNIAYEVNAGNVDAQKLEACKSKWLKPTETVWNMVEYCLDK